MQDMLSFSFDITWCEREIEVLHVRCMGSNLLGLSQADEAVIAHGNSMGLSTFEPTLQGGRCNSMMLCNAVTIQRIVAWPDLGCSGIEFLT